jgi:UDP-N-acetylmuramoylalanine--D-glutamate ligase
MNSLQDQHIVVLGLGISGLAMARWCARCGAHVTVADTREAPPHLAALREQLPQARFVSGAFNDSLLEGAQAVFRSPGLAPAQVDSLLEAARARGLRVGGELDLFVQALEVIRVETEAQERAEQAAREAEQAQEAAQAEEAARAAQAAQAASQVADAEAAESTEPLESTESQADAEAPLPPSADDEPAPLVAPEPPSAGYRPAVLAITGTNGKTTVTSLTGQLVARAGRSVAVAGNIGPSLLDTLAARIDANDLPQVWVLELSSFQLDGITGFEPTAATVLNLSQDHLDWHGSMDAYAAAKARIFGAHGLMVLNREDARVMAMLPEPVRLKGGKIEQRAHITFGADMPQRPGDFGIEVLNGMTWLVRALEADETIKRRRDEVVELHFQRLMPVEALRIRGRHNAVNALSALALAVSAGCPLGPMLYGLREYRGEPHRVEPVGIVGEVEYFDDSKGTNVGATVAALQGLGAERQLVVILGGDGKGQDFSPLADPVARHARAAVLIGRDAPQIRAVLAPQGVTILEAESMEQAVRLAAGRAHAGDAVLMSPACASFDMFQDYEHRARVFREAVRTLADEAGTVLEGQA